MRILDVGCGDNKTKGAVGIDIQRAACVDIICNLDFKYFPFKNNIFDVIICQDVLEHVSNIVLTLQELFRISKNNSIVKIRIPHYTSRYAYNDPFHLNIYGIGVFDFLKQYFEKNNLFSFDIIRKKYIMPKIFRILGINLLANKFPNRYEQLFCYIFPTENLYFELKLQK